MSVPPEPTASASDSTLTRFLAGVGRQVARRSGRVRANALLVVQTGVAAGLSWYVAEGLLGHELAFFAPIAAVIVLGASTGHRLRRTVELVVGVAVGIAVGELLIAALGAGAVQLGLVVTLAAAAALFLGSGSLLVNQAAASAVLITTLFPPEKGIYYTRWLDAAIGGAIAFVVHAVLLPIDPLTGVRKSVRPVLVTLAETLARLARTLADADLAETELVLARLRETEPALARFRESLVGAREIVAVTPIRLRANGSLSRYLGAAEHIDHAMRNSRVLARHAVAAVRNAEPVPAVLPAALDQLSSAVDWLGRELANGQRPEAARGRAINALRLAYSALEHQPQLSTAAITAQIRSIAFDVLLASGLDASAARAASQHARRQAGT